MIVIALEKYLHAAEGEILLKVDFSLKKGEFMCVFGDSGAGKTSLFRMISGLMKPENGRILVNGKQWLNTAANINWKTQNRRVGYVFQTPVLFPNMNVRQNLEYALEKGQEKTIIDRLLAIMELEKLQKRSPKLLSGGQKQRVVLARALVRKPEILLLDEPFSALDDQMRSKLQDYVLQVHREFHLTTLMITHDIAESIKMGSRVALLEAGRFQKQGTPINVFSEQKLSGKFQFTGKVLEIKKEDFLYLVLILIGSDIVKIIVEEEDVRGLQVGETVLVASKAFNPILYKLR